MQPSLSAALLQSYPRDSYCMCTVDAERGSRDGGGTINPSVEFPQTII
jgi:hypothetical protein